MVWHVVTCKEKICSVFWSVCVCVMVMLCVLCRHRSISSFPRWRTGWRKWWASKSNSLIRVYVDWIRHAGSVFLVQIWSISINWPVQNVKLLLDGMSVCEALIKPAGVSLWRKGFIFYTPHQMMRIDTRPCRHTPEVLMWTEHKRNRPAHTQYISL